MFIDKNFKIRGYQKVDFKPNLGCTWEEQSEKKHYSSIINDDKKLFENLLNDGNYIEFRPIRLGSSINDRSRLLDRAPNKELMILKVIYEEFWEFIDDTNPDFEDFILEDKRRIDSKYHKFPILKHFIFDFYLSTIYFSKLNR